MEDIVREMGLLKATISKSFRGCSDISEETRKRILRHK
jgi:DNA-binding LacI/PurR family transcriptional regulator